MKALTLIALLVLMAACHPIVRPPTLPHVAPHLIVKSPPGPTIAPMIAPAPTRSLLPTVTSTPFPSEVN